MYLKSVSALVNRLSAKKSVLLMLSGFVAGWSQITYADDLMDLWKVAEVQDAKYLSAYHKFLADQEIVDLTLGSVA